MKQFILILILWIVITQSNIDDGWFTDVEAQPACSSYNPITKLCQTCYTGYDLNKDNKCIQSDPLCASTNSDGQCTNCYKNFILLNGKCYYASGVNKKSNLRSRSDPLCSIWNNDKCQKCLEGTYLSKDGICKIADPNCRKFNEETQNCDLCYRGYQKKNGICKRII